MEYENISKNKRIILLLFLIAISAVIIYTQTNLQQTQKEPQTRYDRLNNLNTGQSTEEQKKNRLESLNTGQGIDQDRSDRINKLNINN